MANRSVGGWLTLVRLERLRAWPHQFANPTANSRMHFANASVVMTCHVSKHFLEAEQALHGWTHHWGCVGPGVCAGTLLSPCIRTCSGMTNSKLNPGRPLHTR